VSSRDWRIAANDILKAARQIQGYVRGLSEEQFSADQKTYDAVLRQFTIIGEATRHIPNRIREQCTRIHWSDMAGMRNFTVHHYWGVNPTVIWETIKDDLPVLLEEIDGLLKKESDDD